MTELERYKSALEYVLSELRALGLDYAHFTAAVEERVERILNPPPEVEAVDVTVYAAIHPEGYVCGTGTDLAALEKVYTLPGVRFVATKGIDRRPVPRSVERSAKVRFHPSPASTFCYMNGDAMPNSEFIADIIWAETPKGG